MAAFWGKEFICGNNLGSEKGICLWVGGHRPRALKSSSSHLGQFCPEEVIPMPEGKAFSGSAILQQTESQRPLSDANSACCCGNWQSVLVCAEMSRVLSAVSAQPLLFLPPTSTPHFFLLLLKTKKGRGGEGKSLGILEYWGAQQNCLAFCSCIERF